MNQQLLKFTTILFSFFLFIIQSCKEDIQISEQSNREIFSLPNSDNKIVFSLDGIKDEYNSKNNLSTISNNQLDESAILQNQSSEFNGEAYKLSVYEDNMVKKGFQKLSTTNKSPLDQAVKYRLVIYELNNDNSIKSKIYDQAIVNNNSTPISIGVYRNRIYKWIAYSYNNTNEPPSMDTPESVIDIVPTNAGKIGGAKQNEFIYDSGQITTSNELNGNNAIVITFKRKTAALRVVFNALGEFTPLLRLKTSILGANNTLKIGRFNLFQGLYTSTTNFTSNIVTHDQDSGNSEYFQDFKFDELHPQNWAMYSDYYIPVIGNTSSVNLNYTLREITSLKPRWNEDEETQASFRNDVRRYQYSGENGLNFSFPSFNVEAGKRYVLKVDLIASGLKTSAASNVIWARDNLYGIKYLNNSMEYRFDHGNPGFISDISYPYDKEFSSSIKVYNGSSSVVQSTISNIKHVNFMFSNSEAYLSGQRDVCKEVYPKNTWRLPTVSEFNDIINSTLTKQITTYRNTWYFRFADIINSSPYETIVLGINNGYLQNNTLIFTTHGYLDNANVVKKKFYSGDTSIDNYYMRTLGYYKTADPNKYFLLERIASASNSLKISIVTPPSDLNKANIRCIRSTNN